MGANIYETGLERTGANFTPLTPLAFLERAADIHPQRTAVIHGDTRLSYVQLCARARQLASALGRRGYGPGDTIAVMLANTPAMIESHYGAPMCGAVLNALNTRLDAATIAFILDHGEAKVLIADREFAATVNAALAQCKVKPLLVVYDDPQFPQSGEYVGALDYEALLAEGDTQYVRRYPKDEWDAIALNYTSGTTSNPKGVVYHHRGAHLLAMDNALTCAMGDGAVYLWTLPMFHCNGWCFPWTVSAIAGTHVCLRAVRAKPIHDLIHAHGVTHMCGAPIVMSTIMSLPAADKKPYPHVINFMTAGAPPPEAVLAAMREQGFNVTHLYGLTEVYGPAVVNVWKREWDDLPLAEYAALKARQGVRYTMLEGLDVMDPETMQPAPRDGATLGEVMFRGNVVMKGYLKNKSATDEAFAGGWFHSGDLAVIYPDGYIQLKDRSKDIIISGGENISSIEVEDALYKHPSVASAAVVAKPDEKWGETPCAFVELKPDAQASAQELIDWCGKHLARFKLPKTIVFAELPRTSTGKIQKFKLRDQARDL
ncbi:MAG: acyl-CoA synthetase [Alphaproteobacteria bacterium]|nr:acyl-CoA synthetase [Alphaproteobacteria bacterium]